MKKSRRKGTSDLVFWNLIFLEILSLNSKWRKSWSRHVLKQAKTVFFSSYCLSGRIHRFLRKSILHTKSFSNGDQFDSICLNYAYQPVESVVYYGNYDDNIQLFNSFMCSLLNRQQMVFYENKFYHNNQTQIWTKAFQYLRECWCLKRTDTA